MSHRRHLPVERCGLSHSFQIDGHDVSIRTGEFEDGTLGEIFLEVNKAGSTLSGAFDFGATAISLCLQSGVPVSALVDKFKDMNFPPSGYVNGVLAKSIVDYVFRWISEKYGARAA